MSTSNTTRALEKYVRGFSCHRRIQIMEILNDSEAALSLTEIAIACGTSIKPACEHVQRLTASGLVGKTSKKRQVMHDLTPLGRKTLGFLRNIKLT